MSVNTHWLWNPEDLENTPSVQAGISMAEENKLRREGVRMIKEMGKSINLKTNPTLATASVFFHRFYMFNTFADYPPHMMGLACLFLAGKVEETPKKCKDLVQTAKDKYPKQFAGKNLMDELILLERILLQTIRFDLHVEHPYNFLVQYAKGFKLDKDYMSKIVTNAWTFINDSLATNLCLLWEPEVIAVALLYMSFKMARMGEGPEGEAKMGADTEWWDIYVQNLTVPMMEDICHKCNNTLEDDKYFAERCDSAVSAAISILNNSCGIHKNVTKSHSAGYEGCELFFKSMGHFGYCKGPLFGATYTRCLNDPNIKCCKYIADTVTATVEPYCEIFSSSIANNRKEICSDKNTLCESIMNIEAEKAKQACYDTFGISVVEDAAPLEIFKS
uniref:Cyclin-like domain-containing protein n=1 Tax=Meloidogyne javanica TaxID=6303 RepID=A0A915LF72_MELJA